MLFRSVCRPWCSVKEPRRAEAGPGRAEAAEGELGRGRPSWFRRACERIAKELSPRKTALGHEQRAKVFEPSLGSHFSRLFFLVTPATALLRRKLGTTASFLHTPHFTRVWGTSLDAGWRTVPRFSSGSRELQSCQKRQRGAAKSSF